MRQFRTTDTRLFHLNGSEIVETTPLDPSLYDEDETGPMFAAMIAGAEDQPMTVFADEIVEV